MQETLTEFETAKLAKEKGFNPFFYEFEKVPDEMFYEAYDFRKYHYSFLNGKSEKDVELVLPAVYRRKNLNYNFVCYAPTQSLLQKWLREVHSIHIEINKEKENVFFAFNNHSIKEQIGFGSSYEEALEKGLQGALKLIK